MRMQAFVRTVEMASVRLGLRDAGDVYREVQGTYPARVGNNAVFAKRRSHSHVPIHIVTRTVAVVYQSMNRPSS